MTRNVTIMHVGKGDTMILRDANDTKRFIEILDKSKRKRDECWLWQGNIKKRYKKCRSMPYGRFRQELAHRVSWEYANGTEIPQGLFVLHTCDNHQCVNPAHLYAGNANDNNRDKIGKRYIAKRKLDEGLLRHANGEKLKDICKDLGIHRVTLWRYKRDANTTNSTL